MLDRLAAESGISSGTLQEYRTAVITARLSRAKLMCAAVLLLALQASNLSHFMSYRESFLREVRLTLPTKSLRHGRSSVWCGAIRRRE